MAGLTNHWSEYGDFTVSSVPWLICRIEKMRCIKVEFEKILTCSGFATKLYPCTLKTLIYHMRHIILKTIPLLVLQMPDYLLYQWLAFLTRQCTSIISISLLKLNTCYLAATFFILHFISCVFQIVYLRLNVVKSVFHVLTNQDYERLKSLLSTECHIENAIIISISIPFGINI